MPITLSPETEALWVQAATEQGLDPEEWLLTILDTQGYTQADSNDWWNGLTEAQQQAEITAVRQGIEDLHAGRIRPLSQVVAEARTKHNFPASWLAHLDKKSPDSEAQ